MEFLYRLYLQLMEFLYRLYFQLFRIYPSQSFRYQCMTYLMEIHKLRRMGIIQYCDYYGADECFITEKDWEKICKNMEKIVSSHNKDFIETFKILSNKGFEEFVESALMSEPTTQSTESYLKLIEFKQSDYPTQTGYKYVLKVTNNGYRYQFNGYRNTTVKFQEKANIFAIITLFATTFKWLQTYKYIDISNKTQMIFAISTYILIFIGYRLRKKPMFWKFIYLLIISLSAIA